MRLQLYDFPGLLFCTLENEYVLKSVSTLTFGNASSTEKHFKNTESVHLHSFAGKCCKIRKI